MIRKNGNQRKRVSFSAFQRPDNEYLMWHLHSCSCLSARKTGKFTLHAHNEMREMMI